MNTLLHMFNYTFIIRAFIVGLLISLCAAMLGVNLVLRKNAMISDGLSMSLLEVLRLRQY